MPIYWAFLTYMLLRPGVENKEYWFQFEGLDKILHFSIFGVLGFTFMAAYPKTRLLTYIYIMLIYGFLTEILQSEMKLGRSLEFGDIIADTLGFLMGYFFCRKFKENYIN